MKNTIIALVAVALIGGGIYWFTQGAPTDTTEEASMEEAQAGAFEGSFMELAARGGEWECTFTSATQVGNSSGTVYVSGEKIRGDFAIEAPYIGATEVHMVSDGEYTYTWGPLMPQGVKAKVAKGETANTDTPTQAQMFDAQMALTYDCNPAQNDSGLFVPPGDVSFTTIN